MSRPSERAIAEAFAELLRAYEADPPNPGTVDYGGVFALNAIRNRAAELDTARVGSVEGNVVGLMMVNQIAGQQQQREAGRQQEKAREAVLASAPSAAVPAGDGEQDLSRVRQIVREAFAEYDIVCAALGRLVAGIKAAHPDFPDCDDDDAERDVLRGILRFIAERAPPAVAEMTGDVVCRHCRATECLKCKGQGWYGGNGYCGGTTCSDCKGAGSLPPAVAEVTEADRLWKWVGQAFDASKTSACEQILDALKLPTDSAEMPLSWHINRATAARQAGGERDDG